MSYNTFRKYAIILMTKGCFKEYGTKQSIQLKSTEEIIEILDLPIEIKRMNYILKEYPKKIDNQNFTEATRILMEALTYNQLKKQLFKSKAFDIEIVKSIAFSGKNKHQGQKKFMTKHEKKQHRKIFKASQKENIKAETFCKRLLKNEFNEVKTGSHFLGKKFGVSHSFMNDILHSLNDSLLIKRTIIQRMLNYPVNNYMTEQLKNEFKGWVVIPIKKRNQYRLRRGSKIDFVNDEIVNEIKETVIPEKNIKKENKTSGLIKPFSSKDFPSSTSYPYWNCSPAPPSPPSLKSGESKCSWTSIINKSERGDRSLIEWKEVKTKERKDKGSNSSFERLKF